MTPNRFIGYDGHQLAYRVSGEGPALVALWPYKFPRDAPQAQLADHGWEVFQLQPVGTGHSTRVPGYCGELLADQVLAVLDHHGVDRFVVWGFSAGGAMALCIARETERAAGVICGALTPLDFPTPGMMRQMDKRLEPNHASRSLWWWFRSLDWAEELPRLACPALFYYGANDRMAKGLRRAQQLLHDNDLTFVEFPGLGHEAGGDPAIVKRLVVPTVLEWAYSHSIVPGGFDVTS